MDDIFLPDESEDELLDEPLEFEKAQVSGTQGSRYGDTGHPSGVNPSDYVKITFGRFVTLVANHSFFDVVENNKDEEVILTTNLLTDLANAKRFAPKARVPLMVLFGLAVGFLFGYVFF